MHFSNKDYSVLVERYWEDKADAFVRATAERNLAQIKQTEALDQKLKKIGTEEALRRIIGE
jgi:hypothetical protein